MNDRLKAKQRILKFWNLDLENKVTRFIQLRSYIRKQNEFFHLNQSEEITFAEIIAIQKGKGHETLYVIDPT